jgi:hypothetical protein
MGFRQIYGNFSPHIKNYEVRKKRPTLLGGAPSAWFATGEAGFGKDMLPDFLGSTNILWRGDVIDGKELSGIIQSLLPVLRTRLRGEVPPSQTEPDSAPVDIAGSFNSGAAESSLGVDLTGLKTGTASSGNVRFEVADRGVIVGTDGVEKTGLPREAVVKIGQDATSVLFLHASARPATNKEMYRLMWDMEDNHSCPLRRQYPGMELGRAPVTRGLLLRSGRRPDGQRDHVLRIRVEEPEVGQGDHGDPAEGYHGLPRRTGWFRQ